MISVELGETYLKYSIFNHLTNIERELYAINMKATKYHVHYL